jgi:hypothetical protein
VAASVQELKAALKSRLETISGARAFAVQPAAPPDNALTVLGPVRWAYDTTFDGLVQYFFEVGVYLSPADLGRAQTRLDAFLAPTGSASIKAAVEGGSPPGTLGGVADYARVVGGNEYGRLVDVAGSQLLHAVVEVEVRSQ